MISFHPYRKDRNSVRRLLGKNEFVEIYVKCPVEVCEQRDVKELYKKARKGEIKDFTGVNAPYEEPENPEIIIETNLTNEAECANKIYKQVIEFIR